MLFETLWKEQGANCSRVEETDKMTTHITQKYAAAG